MSTPNGEKTARCVDTDVAVIGAGPAGLALLGALKGSGLDVTVVEDELVGGECRYYGCVVSKAMLRPLEVHDSARAMRSVPYDAGRVDVTALFERRDTMVDDWDDTQFVIRMIDAVGAHLVRGKGRLADRATVTVAGPDGAAVTVRARQAVVIAVGRRASYPAIHGIHEVQPWTNRPGTGAHTVPVSLVVLGGGPAGCELATTWAALGSEITLVHRGPELLPTLEPEASERVLAGLRRRGVSVILGLEAIDVHRDSRDRVVRTTLSNGQTLFSTELLLAIGTAPASADIGLEAIGVPAGRLIAVHGSTEVIGGGKGLYAIGNCTDQAGLTHMGQYQAAICASVIKARHGGRDLEGAYSAHDATAERTAVTQALFTDPQVASAGLTESQARTKGFNVLAVSAPIEGPVAGRLHEDDYHGLAKLVIDADTDRLLGATFIGRDVSNMVHAATVAIVGEVPVTRLRHAVPPFPTMGGVWVDLLTRAHHSLRPTTSVPHGHS